MVAGFDQIPDYVWGKYKLSTSENFDNFLKEMGIGLVKRKLANSVSPTVEVIKGADQTITFKTNAIVKSSETRLRLNEEFEEARLDDKMVKSIVHFEPPNKLVQTQNDEQLQIKYIREFVDNQIRVTSIANGVQCYRVYDRVKE